MPLFGLDIGGTRIKAAVVGQDGSILVETAAATPSRLAEFRDTVRGMIESFDGWDAAGVACKGIINATTTRVDVLPGTLHYLEGFVLADLFPDGTVVKADNDARATMAGEIAWGAARGRRNALLATLGTGVGGAVLAEGRLVRGAGGVGGHLGHLTVEVDGGPCICGNHGCLETVFSAKAIEAEAFAAVNRGCATSLRADDLSCQSVFAAAAAGDPIAVWIRDRAIRRLGAALAGVVHLLDPEVIIVGGQIAEAGDALFSPLRREIHWRTESLLRRKVPVVATEVADTSGVAGAAALAMGC
jgi:glucokinase